MRNFSNRLGQTGDTIIEVLLVLAVLGFAFAVSAATANKGLLRARVSEEHSQQIGTLNTQVELLRQANANQVSLPITPGTQFCMVSASVVHTFTGSPDAPCIFNSFYGATISCGAATTAVSPPECAYYNLAINWDGPSGDAGVQQERYVYRIHPISNSVTGISLQSTQAQVLVDAPVTQLSLSSGSDTPSCTSTSSSNLSVPVTLTDMSRSDHPSDTESTVFNTATFSSNIYPTHTYAVTSVGVPLGYYQCMPFLNTVTAQTSSPNSIRTHLVAHGHTWTGWPSTCTITQGPYHDTWDYCHQSGNSLVVRRNMQAVYTAASSDFPADSNAAPAIIVIHYNQYNSDGATYPPQTNPAYQFQLTVKAGNQTTNLSLPVQAGQNSWQDTYIRQSVQIPANTSSIELDWTNNYGVDPDLQINSVQLYYN